MIRNGLLERYLAALLQGDRKTSRAVIEEALQSGTPANMVYADIIWPIMVEIEKLMRSDTITPAQEHMATRINRTIVDQLQNKLPRRSPKDKKIVVCSSEMESRELGAQMMADMFESEGWEVKFLGGGLNNEDVLSFVNNYGPDVLLIYGTIPQQAPGIRKLIDTIKDINAWPEMRIMVSGGLFNRAEELWVEMGADLFAATAQEAVQVASKENSQCLNKEKTINRRKKKHKVTATAGSRV